MSEAKRPISPISEPNQPSAAPSKSGKPRAEISRDDASSISITPNPNPHASLEQAVADLPLDLPLDPPPSYDIQTGDTYWLWQLSLRALLVVTALIGIGCATFPCANFNYVKRGIPYNYELRDAWSMRWTLITFTASTIWNSFCIVVFFVRRPRAHVPSAIRTPTDFVLWLGFIATTIFALVAVRLLADWGSHGVIGDATSPYGYYAYRASNGSWTWNAGDIARDCKWCGKVFSYHEYFCYSYQDSTCAEEDVYVNRLWKGKQNRMNVEIAATVCQFFGLILHLVFFVWGFLDTHFSLKEER